MGKENNNILVEIVNARFCIKLQFPEYSMVYKHSCHRLQLKAITDTLMFTFT